MIDESRRACIITRLRNSRAVEQVLAAALRGDGLHDADIRRTVAEAVVACPSG